MWLNPLKYKFSASVKTLDCEFSGWGNLYSHKLCRHAKEQSLLHEKFKKEIPARLVIRLEAQWIDSSCLHFHFFAARPAFADDCSYDAQMSSTLHRFRGSFRTSDGLQPTSDGIRDRHPWKICKLASSAQNRCWMLRGAILTAPPAMSRLIAGRCCQDEMLE